MSSVCQDDYTMAGIRTNVIMRVGEAGGRERDEDRSLDHLLSVGIIIFKIMTQDYQERGIWEFTMYMYVREESLVVIVMVHVAVQPVITFCLTCNRAARKSFAKTD